MINKFLYKNIIQKSLQQEANFFQDRSDHKHAGIDFNSQKSKQYIIYNIIDGKLGYKGQIDTWGNFIRIDHDMKYVNADLPQKFHSAYCHLDKIILTKQKNEFCQSGSKLGFMGNTGRCNTSGVHLHLCIYQDTMQDTSMLHELILFNVKNRITYSTYLKQWGRTWYNPDLVISYILRKGL